MNFDLSDPRLDELLSKIDLLEKQARIGIFVFIFVLTQVAFVGSVWMDQVAQAQSLERKIQSELAKLENQAKVMEERLELERALRRLRSYVPELVAGFPAEDDIPELLDSIYRRLSSNGLSLVNFKPEKAKKESGLLQIPVNVLLEGEPGQIAVIPNLLAGLSRKVNLGDFSIGQGRGSEGSWQFRGELKAFAQLPDDPFLKAERVGGNETTRGFAR